MADSTKRTWTHYAGSSFENSPPAKDLPVPHLLLKGTSGQIDPQNTSTECNTSQPITSSQAIHKESEKQPELIHNYFGLWCNGKYLLD